MNQSYAAQVNIPYHAIIEQPEFVERMVERMKREGSWEIFQKIYGAGTPVVVETHLEEWKELDSVRYTLHYRLTAVRTRDVVLAEMPVFTFTNHEGQVEWKCPACSIINKIEATYCGELHEHAVGCGRPRDEVRK